MFETWNTTGLYLDNSQILYVWDSDAATMDYIVENVSYEEAADVMGFMDLEGDERLGDKYGIEDWDDTFSDVYDRVSFMKVLVELGVISSMSQVECDVKDGKALSSVMSEIAYL